jgi:hypothetical protein
MCCSVVAGTLRVQHGLDQACWAWCVPAAASDRYPLMAVEDVLRVAMLLPPSGSNLPISSGTQVTWWTLLHGCEFADAGAAALEGGLHGQLDSERRGGGGGRLFGP